MEFHSLKKREGGREGEEEKRAEGKGGERRGEERRGEERRENFRISQSTGLKTSLFFFFWN
jgi:hypothetical protein